MANKTESMLRDFAGKELLQSDRAKTGSIDDRSTVRNAHENTVNSMLVLMALSSLVGIIAALSFDRNPNTPAVQSGVVQTNRDLPRQPISNVPQSIPTQNIAPQNTAPQNTVPQNTVLQNTLPQNTLPQLSPAVNSYPAAPEAPAPVIP